MEMLPILIVDDDIGMRTALFEVLKRKNYKIQMAENGRDAIKALENGAFSVVITDVNMPHAGGVEVLKAVKRISPLTPVIMITAFGTIENAVEAMKIGASDYILKPFSAEVLDSVIKKTIAPPANKSGIITENANMKRILEMARSVADSNATVLIMGESGTGKELMARYIHENSLRKDGPFIAVNCASIPEGLLESELFGYERGAFTGAISRKAGKFELANNGTMLLDEVSEMPVSLQAKLLRVLQQREVDRIGGKEPVALDIRVIATTNRDLKKEVNEGRFREDLFYRLNVFPINLPPLRERVEDIPILVNYFLGLFNQKNKKAVKNISHEALNLLNSYQWKGNIRELENIMERAVLLASGDEILPENVFPDASMAKTTAIIQTGAAPPASPTSLFDMEREMIKRALEDTSGNRTKAAKILGISVRTLRNKINEYGWKEMI